MIRCHLARMMGEHKMRIADVARETGLSRATVTLLYKETAQKDASIVTVAGIKLGQPKVALTLRT